MTPTLHLIWGPTTTGKTSASIALAKREGIPVISLDRIQCCPELAIGSGRPSVEELRGTTRIYITSRELSRGIISATEAHGLLKQLVAEYGTRYPRLILEGGSISLFNELVTDSHWASFQWTFKHLVMAPRHIYLSHARRRVREMLHPQDGRSSLLVELAQLWRDPALRAALEDIDGYRCAIQFSRARHLNVPELQGMDATKKEELIGEIAEEYFQHAQIQTREFRQIPSSWADHAGVHVISTSWPTSCCVNFR